MASNGSLKDFAKDAALGAAATASTDAFFEISRIPGFNDPAPNILQFGTDKLSNIELALWIGSIFAAGIGFVEIVGGKSLLPGFGKTLAGYGLGGGLGLIFYENNIAPFLGIRDTT